jgi:hypothetical protein
LALKVTGSCREQQSLWTGDFEREALWSTRPLKRSGEDTVEQIGEPILHGGGLERRRSSGAEIMRSLTIGVIGRIGENGTFLETDFGDSASYNRATSRKHRGGSRKRVWNPSGFPVYV